MEPRRALGEEPSAFIVSSGPGSEGLNSLCLRLPSLPGRGMRYMRSVGESFTMGWPGLPCKGYGRPGLPSWSR